MSQGADGNFAMTRNSSMEESALWLTRHSRYSSNASIISGPVMQVGKASFHVCLCLTSAKSTFVY